MNTAPQLALSVLIAVVAGAATAYVLGPGVGAGGSSAAAGTSPLESLLKEVNGLRVAQEATARRLGELEAQAAMATGGARQAAGVSADQLEYWARENAELLQEIVEGGPGGALAGDDTVTERDLVEAMDILLDEGVDDLTKQELWMELAEKGATDDLIAMFEERVQLDPTNPQAHVDLGGGFLRKIFEVGSSPAAGLWANKADDAFDAALELDPDHWQARFTKAVSLSFWPPIFNKQSEAISQFETLIDVQKNLPADPDFAQTYLLLGNMHQQKGNAEEALKVWQEGLASFPESDGLLQALAGVESGG